MPSSFVRRVTHACCLVRTALVFGLLCWPATSGAQIELQLSRRAQDGTVYMVLNLSAAYANAGIDALRITSVAGGVNGLTPCLLQETSEVSAQVGANLSSGMLNQPFNSTSRTAVLRVDDLAVADFAAQGSGRLTLGVAGNSIDICLDPTNCMGGAADTSIVVLDLPDAGVSAACMGTTFACHTSVSSFLFGLPASGDPPSCEMEDPLTRRVAICDQPPDDGFTLHRGEVVVFVFTGQLGMSGFTFGAAGFAIDEDGDNQFGCPPNSVVGADAQVLSVSAAPQPTSTPDATVDQGQATPTPTTTPLPSPCLGDCDDDGSADAADITRIVSLIVGCGGAAHGCGGSPLGCANADANGNGSISAAELTQTLANVLHSPDGCPPPPTATRTPPCSPTPTPVLSPTAAPTMVAACDSPVPALPRLRIDTFVAESGKAYHLLSVPVAPLDPGFGVQVTSLAISADPVRTLVEPRNAGDCISTSLAGVLAGGILPPLSQMRRTDILHDLFPFSVAQPRFDSSGDGRLQLFVTSADRFQAFVAWNDGNGGDPGGACRTQRDLCPPLLPLETRSLEATCADGTTPAGLPAAAVMRAVDRTQRGARVRFDELIVFPNNAATAPFDVVSSGGSICEVSGLACDPLESVRQCQLQRCLPGGERVGQSVTLDDGVGTRIGNPSEQPSITDRDGFLLLPGDFVVFVTDPGEGPVPVNASAAGFAMDGAGAVLAAVGSN